MDYRIVDNFGKKYIEFLANGQALTTEMDVADCISACMEHDIFSVLLHGEGLSPDFFDLRTGFAGNAIQKFVNYRVRVAVLMPLDGSVNKRYGEMMLEANKGNHFRTFPEIVEAEKWIQSFND